MEKKAKDTYLIRTLLLRWIFPILSVWIELIREKTPLDPALIGKWFIFWSFGAGLFTEGISRLLRPRWALQRMVRTSARDSFPIVRELAFANLSMGLVGGLSIIDSQWRQLAAIAGGLYFGLAGIQHLLKRPESIPELIVMISDQLLFSVILLYLFFTLVAV